MLTDAVILAGGKGSRLEPYTKETAKPLVLIGQRPIIEILIGGLYRSGIRRLHIAVNHFADKIEELLGDGSRLGMEIHYSHESKPLSTIGPLTLIENLPEHFLVVNGDILTDLDYSTLYRSHLESGCKLSVAVYNRKHISDYGVIKSDGKGRVIGFEEKPSIDYTVSMGVYLFSRELLACIPRDQKFGFDDLMHTLLKNNEAVNAFCYEGYWLDIGRISDYQQANLDIKKIEKQFE